MVEKKIYSPWAFSKDEYEKRDRNLEIYKELKEKYRIHGCGFKLSSSNDKDSLFADYDIVYGKTRAITILFIGFIKMFLIYQILNLL